jgi:hypothetical protein
MPMAPSLLDSKSFLWASSTRESTSVPLTFLCNAMACACLWSHSFMLLARSYDGAWGEGKSDKGKDKATAQPELTSCDANGVSCCTVLA